MPGSGKSTLGKIMAKELAVTFYDLDEEIEKQELKTISEIFMNHGEAYFREIEHRKLVELLQSSDAMMIAAGGGTPCFFEAMDLMNKNSITIFLDTPLQEIHQRIQSTNLPSRPMFKGLKNEEAMDRLEKIYAQRLPVYRRARYIVKGKADISDLLSIFR